MKKNRIGTQGWPWVASSALSSTRLLNGTTQRIAVRHRNVFIAFAETSK